jgi:hypothetical protein
MTSHRTSTPTAYACLLCNLAVAGALILFGLSQIASAQNWTGILDPSRAIDWSAINPGVVGGIPTGRTQCGSTLAAGTSAANINTAIAACGANQYVQLGAGTFNLSTGLIFNGVSNVTLRGMGPDQTFLAFSGSQSCDGHNADICVMGYSGCEDCSAVHTTTWTGGYAQGKTSITVGSTSGMVVGQLLILSQANDKTDTGGIWVNDTLGAASIEGVCGPDNGPQSGHCLSQVVTVTGISGNTLTISPGVYETNFRAGNSPQVWWTGTGNKPSTGCGIEAVSIDNTNAGSYSIISFHNTTNGWVKNIRTIHGTRDHIGMWIANHIEVRDSYFYATAAASSQSYGTEPEFASDDLVINNIFHYIYSPTMMGNDAGSVYAYNFAINMYTTNPPTFMQTSLFGSHDAGTNMLLYEGNDGTQALWDTFHGAGGNQSTFFRSYLSGWEPNKTGGGTIPIAIWANNRAQNIIGNALGQAGFHDTYQDQTDNSNTAIYSLGEAAWAGNSYNGVAFDSKVATTLMRWGNYDVVNAAIRWDATESSPAAVPYVNANSTPATHTLPSSFFLTGEPAWWPSGKNWPPIGPDVTTGNSGTCSGGTYSGSKCTVGGSQCSGGGSCVTAMASHVTTIPARDCYVAMGGPADGSGNVLTFNANSCYSTTVGSNPPAPPTSLAAVVH